MAEESEQAGGDFDVAVRPELVGEVGFKQERRRDRAGPLGEIESEDEGAESSAEDSTDVGGADVAAAVFEDVDAAHAREEIAEGDRSDEIGGEHGQGGDEPGHEVTQVG